MTTHKRLIHFIKKHESAMFDLLEEMVLIQSGSHNKGAAVTRRVLV